MQSTESPSSPIGYGGGIVGFLVLVLDILVIIEVLKSDRDILSKVAWIALVLLFPVFGALIYMAVGHNRHTHTHGYHSIP